MSHDLLNNNKTWTFACDIENNFAFVSFQKLMENDKKKYFYFDSFIHK